ncbi:hypothetical protein BDZ91DRAFT_419695 [Kalaharituber pfeilii]|nr:hypothetical protein BDZ91DRAFT_419695 [Kalaharituber pfeilii]
MSENSSVLAPTTAVAIIWSLYFILTVTILLRFYAGHIHHRRERLRRARHHSRTLPESPRNRFLRSSTFTTLWIIFIHIFATFYCTGISYAIRWGYTYSEKRIALAIRYGGSESEIATLIISRENEVGRLRWDLQRVGIAVEIAYLVIVWSIKFGLLCAAWEVGKGLRLWGIIPVWPEGVQTGDENNSAVKKPPVVHPATTKRITIARIMLYASGCITLLLFLAVIVYESIVDGMALGRNEPSDISSRNLGKEVKERQTAIIVSSVGSLGTYLLLIAFGIILFLNFRSPHQLHPRSHPTFILPSATLLLALMILTTGASIGRTAYILVSTVTITPRVGDIITGGVLFGRATGATYASALGLHEKIFTVLEMMLGGIAICLPGLRVLFYGGCSSKKSRIGVKMANKQMDTHSRHEGDRKQMKLVGGKILHYNVNGEDKTRLNRQGIHASAAVPTNTRISSQWHDGNPAAQPTEVRSSLCARMEIVVNSGPYSAAWRNEEATRGPRTSVVASSSPLAAVSQILSPEAQFRATKVGKVNSSKNRWGRMEGVSRPLDMSYGKRSESSMRNTLYLHHSPPQQQQQQWREERNCMRERERKREKASKTRGVSAFANNVIHVGQQSTAGTKREPVPAASVAPVLTPTPARPPAPSHVLKKLPPLPHELDKINRVRDLEERQRERSGNDDKKWSGIANGR